VVSGVLHLTISLITRLHRPLTVDEALPFIYQILDGLAYSHSVPMKMEKPDGVVETMYGIVHRDLKPSNFFIQNIDDKSILTLGCENSTQISSSN
jgi:serine/threonine protein kinase